MKVVLLRSVHPYVNNSFRGRATNYFHMTVENKLPLSKRGFDGTSTWTACGIELKCSGDDVR